MKRPIIITVCGLKRPKSKRLLAAIGEMAKAAASYEAEVAALFRPDRPKVDKLNAEGLRRARLRLERDEARYELDRFNFEELCKKARRRAATLPRKAAKR